MTSTVKCVQIRQGDVLLLPARAPKNPVRVTDEYGQPLAGLVVAGERTGHAHRLAARVYDAGDRRLLLLERPTPITHEEHAEIEVPAGWWEVRLQREYVPQERKSSRRFD